MIVEIDGYEINDFLSGKKCSESKLCCQVFKALEHMEDRKHFTAVFCRMFNYEKISFCDIEPDYVVDIDISKVYKPFREE